MKKDLFVIDAYNLIYRMFYAIPEMHTREGIQVNAIFGVAKFLKNLSEENPNAEVIVATDLGSSFREDLFQDYKGTRDKMPDNLRSQIDGVFDLFHSAKIPVIGKEGYEADDIMGSIATNFSSESVKVIIISSDKDLCQFVRDDYVHIYDAMKKKFMREIDVLEKFGVPTSQVRDYLAIVGDSADNIPGISGFGPKKTKDLLLKYHSLDGIYDNLNDYTPKMQETLLNHKELAYLSQKLATIITDLDISFVFNGKFSDNIKNDKYIQFLKKYEFRSLIPAGDQEVIERKHIEVLNIFSFSQYEALYHKWKTSGETLFIITDENRRLYISYNQKVYIFDYKQIDITDMIGDILDGKIRVISYGMKKIFGELEKIKNPLFKNRGQDSLF